MKQTKVYKVLKFNDKKRLVSTFSPFAKKYAIGITTKPEKGTKLFAFRRLRDAKKYAEKMSGRIVYRAMATGVKKNGWFSGKVTLITLRKLFSGELLSHYCYENHATYFPSCVVCDTITLEKAIK